MTIDFLGPGALGADNYTTTKPSVFGSDATALPTYFIDCDEVANSAQATRLKARWFDLINENFREAASGLGVTPSNQDTQVLLKMFQKAIEIAQANGVDLSAIQAEIDAKVAKAGDTMTGVLKQPAGTAAAPALTSSGDTTSGIFYPSSNSIAISTNSSERFRVGSSGQLGIGGANYGNTGDALISQGASSPPIYAPVSVKAWLRWNGGILSSYNIASVAQYYNPNIAMYGPWYTINFTNPMPNNHYSVVVSRENRNVISGSYNMSAAGSEDRGYCDYFNATTSFVQVSGYAPDSTTAAYANSPAFSLAILG